MGAQFLVQLENRTGALAELTRALAARGVDIRSIAGGGTGSHGYATVATDDDAATRTVLRMAGYVYVEGEALIVDVEDRPGGFAEVAERLAAADVDISAVLVLGRKPGAVETAFTVDDVGRARRALGLG